MKEEMPGDCYDIYHQIKVTSDCIEDIDTIFRDKVEERLILEKYEKNQEIVKTWEEMLEKTREITTNLYQFIANDKYRKKYLEPVTLKIEMVEVM